LLGGLAPFFYIHVIRQLKKTVMIKNNYELTLLKDILDVNWDISNPEISRASKDALITRLNELTNELIEQMGVEAYNEFMLNGHEMFKSK
jgi:hypothetical protein